MNEPRDRPGGAAWVSLDLPRKTTKQLHEISEMSCRNADRFTDARRVREPRHAITGCVGICWREPGDS